MNNVSQHALTVLAADVLATRAAQLLSQLSVGNWDAATALKDALDLYSEVRLGAAITTASAAALPTCDCCKYRTACNGICSGGDCYEPETQRSPRIKS